MNKKQNFAYDPSALPAYVNENSDELFEAALFGFKTAGLVEIQEGIKLTDALHTFEANPTRLEGTCGMTATGDAVFVDKNITVSKIGYKMSFCADDLEAKWTQRELAAGANAQDLQFAFGERIMSRALANIAQTNETDVWQDTSALGTYHFDGFIFHIDAGSPINGNPTGITVATGITNTNAFGIVQGMCNLIPAGNKGDAENILFVGQDTFDAWADNLFNLNLYHQAGVEGYSATIPTKGVRIEGVAGLNGTDRMFLGKKSNFVLGTDLANDYEVMDSWYSKDDDLTYVQTKFKMGTQVVFDDEIVEFTLVP